jgi:hypothetical protein
MENNNGDNGATPPGTTTDHQSSHKVLEGAKQPTRSGSSSSRRSEKNDSAPLHSDTPEVSTAPHHLR